MTSLTRTALTACALIGFVLGGCSKDKAAPSTDTPTPAAATPATPATPPPTFVLAISEYPSWSAFLAADELGLIDGDAGKLGPVEKEYNVDIDLKLTDYDTCLTLAGTGKADAVALTNMDALIPAQSTPSVVILPTSTSNGADALIVPKSVTKVQQLKGKNVYMLAKSVSEYAFYRNLKKLGEDPSDYTVVNMDPQAAATAMQQKKSGYDAIMVWNPFVLDTLEARPDVHVLFSSTSIPNEIIDSIVASQASLDKPGGDRFAQAVVATYYGLNKKLRDGVTHRDTLMAIGAKFSNITDPTKMEAIVVQTKFYGTSGEGLAVLNPTSLTPTMTTVAEVYKAFGVTERDVTVSVGTVANGSDLRFDPSYMLAVKAKNGL